MKDMGLTNKICIFGMIITFSMLNSFYTLMPGTDAPSLHAKSDNPSVSGFNFMCNKDLEKEIWEDVREWEGIYEVSSFGRIKRGDRLLKQSKTKKGYFRVMLSNSGFKKKYFVHRLVAFAFVPNLNEYTTVNHINFIKTDNQYKNLEWMSVTENAKDAWVKGKVPYQKGVNAYEATFTEEEVLDIYYSNDTCTNIAKRYNRPYTTIYCVKSGRCYRDITGGVSNIKNQYQKNGKYTKSSNN